MVVEARMVRQQVVRRAAAVQSDAAVGSPGPRYRVDLVAAAEPAKAAHPVRAAAAPGAAATGAVVPDALVVAVVPAVLVVVEPDALVVAPVPAVAGSVAAVAFSPSPFPDLLEALGRSQARYRMVWRGLIQAPQSTKSRRQTAAVLFWTSLPISRCKKGNFRFKVVADESVPTGAQNLSIDLECR